MTATHNKAVQWDVKRDRVMPARNDENRGLLKPLAEMFNRLARDFSDPYRPERHYMRGPGPRWREKHARTNMAAVAEPTVNGLAQARA